MAQPQPSVQSAPGDATKNDRPGAADTVEASHHCPRCSARLTPRKCKMICSECGYYMSCSDFY